MRRVRSWLVMGVALALGVAMASDAMAQRRGGSTRGGSFLGLVGNETVQKELKLNEDQLGKVKKMTETLGTEMREQFGALREMEDRDKRRAKMIELTEKLDDKTRGQLSEILEREQMMRLYQIRLQVRGAIYGLNNRYVAARLELTDEQKKKAATLEEATQKKTSGLFSGLRDLSDEERRAKYGELREKMTKIRAEAEKKALGLLTDDQKEAFEKMKGEKVEL